MADIDLKSATPDTSLPSTGFLFGADSQAAASPSVYSTQTVATALLGSSSLTGATITADSPVINAAQTWNNAAVTFTGLKANITDTASNAASLLMDLQVGGTSQFKVRKDGRTSLTTVQATTANLIFYDSGASDAFAVQAYNVGVRLTNLGAYGFSSTTSPVGTTDLFLTRRAAANLRLGAADAAAPVAQTLSVQSVVAGTTNTAGANLTITGSQGTGTGAGGSIVFQVAPAGSSGTAQNALVDALFIYPSGSSRIISTSGNANTVGVHIFNSGTLRLNDGSVNGSFSPATWKWPSTASVGWVSTGDGNGAALDTILTRDAANTLALRNGANAQTFRVYNTTDGTNGNWIELAGGAFSGIYPRIAGTGTNSGLILAGSATGNSAPLYLRFQYNQNGWRLDTSANLLAETDNAYDIGASGANRPRNIYAATSITGPHRMTGTAPASATATGTAGDLRYDADYIYICTATDTWKRVAIATWP